MSFSFSIFEPSIWNVQAADLVAANPALANLGLVGELRIARQDDGSFVLCPGGGPCTHHVAGLVVPESASRVVRWPTVAVYAGLGAAGLAGWWVWKRQRSSSMGSPMLMRRPWKRSGLRR